MLRQLRDEGKTIILITHKLREIMAITDNVSVMRQGEMVATRATAETSVAELAELMVGRRVLLTVDKQAATPGDSKLSVRKLTVKDGRGVTMVDDVSFSVRAGEIVGIAGVAGNGQSELLEALSGIRKAESGATRPQRPRDRPGWRGRPRRNPPDRLRPCAGGPPPYGPRPAPSRKTRTPFSAIRTTSASRKACCSIRPPCAGTPGKRSRPTTSARPTAG